MGKHLILLMVLLQLAIVGFSQSKNYRVRQWTSREGLPQNSIPEIIQDKKGFIWLTTLEGLIRFDGYELKIYNSRTRSDIFYNRMLQVVEDKSGHIWISTEEGGLYHFDREKFVYYTREELGLTGYITAISVIEDGSLLLGTTGGGFLFGTEGEGLFNFKEGICYPISLPQVAGKRISRIFNSSDGMIWIASGNGMYRMNQSFENMIQISKGWILDIDELNKNEIIYITGNELCKININTLKKSAILKADKVKNNFSHITVDNNKAIWLSTDTEDFYRIEDDNIVNVELEQNLSIPIMWSLLCDKEGNIWVGSNGSGLLQLSEVSVQNIQVKDGLPNNIIWSISKGRNGNKYVSTYNGFARIDKEGSVYEFPIENPQMSRLFWSSYEDKTGKLWIGSSTEGLLTLANNQIERVSSPFPALRTGVKAFHESEDGTLWIGTSNGVFTHKNGTFKKVSFGEEKNKNIKTIIAQGDSILVGTGRGLFTIKELVAKRFIHDKIQAGVRDIWVDEGLLWIATEGYGLYIHDLFGSTYQFTTSEGMFDNFISHIYPAPDGTIWFTTNTGIFAVPKQLFYQKMSDWNSVDISFRLYNELDGMAVSEVNGGVYPSILSDGDELWVPTMSGIAIFNHKKVSTGIEPFPILITSVEVNNIFVQPNEKSEIHIESGASILALSFSGLSFRNPERLTFEYKLDDNRDWVSIGKSRQLRFENIDAGRHVLSIRSPLSGGIYATMDQPLVIVKDPQFFQTAWFWLLMLGTTVGLAYAASQQRIKTLLKREQELEDIVSERTRDLNKAKEQIEKSYRQLSDRNDQLRDLVHIKNDFVSMATHDLRSPLHSILGFSDILQEDSDEESLARALTDKIRGSSLKMLDIIENILSRVREDKQEIDIKKHRSNLTRLINAIIEENSLAALSKGQLFKVNVDENVFANIDEFWMGRAFENIVANAIKYSPTKSNIEISLHQKDSKVVFAVDDEGPGIPDKDKENVFGMYYKSENRPTAGEFSSGIGLAIVKQVVDHHAGTIHILDSERGGCRIEIGIPR